MGGSNIDIDSHTFRKVTSCSTSARPTFSATWSVCGRVTIISFDPRVRVSKPAVCSSRSASRTVERLTPNCLASSFSEGRRSPLLNERCGDPFDQRCGDFAVRRFKLNGFERMIHRRPSFV